jgi:sugar (pentulose or hexulose) kinase
MQIHADVLGTPIRLPADAEACALGSALVAAVHAGRFASLDEATRSMVRMAGGVEPNATNRAAYDELYGRYVAAYPALKGLMTS